MQTASFKDYAPNGLQVEGREYIGKIVTSVTASRAAIDFAVEQKADLLLVHHGMFWKNELPTVTGWKKERIAALLRHDINMAGYHLPWMCIPYWATMPNSPTDWVLRQKNGSANKPAQLGQPETSQDTRRIGGAY
ncbi:metal-binding protein [Neisseria gonorrhoeae]|uniref:Metal-binding protein n=1 Tax=Neisseria gonorrhoeae TaxID=485 RepID=A0A378W1L2_NEIGO|nr:metal-binding protein [Neisseria gonorrhoeae]